MAGRRVDERKEDEKSDVRVINRAGYTDTTHPAHIWTVGVSDNVTAPVNATQLTSGASSANGIA